MIPVLDGYDTRAVIGMIQIEPRGLYLELHPGHEMTPAAVQDLLGGAGWILLDGLEVEGVWKVRRARIVCWSPTGLPPASQRCIAAGDSPTR